MNKLVYKLFYSNKIFVYFSVLTIIFLTGCTSKIIGNATQKMPNEISKYPEVYFCPGDDCGKVLETHIKSANFSVHCAFYDINLRNIISALAKKSKTADVKMIMDKSNYKDQVKGEGIRLDTDGQLMHNKFCVFDGNTIITGSFNPTDRDNNYNNNNIVVVYSNALAKNYEEEFDELWDGKFGNGDNAKYHVLYINNIKIENYFCPEDCRLELSSSINKDKALYKIIELVKNAKESVKVASFTFTHETIADELVKAQARGINVTILIENRQRNVINSQYKRVKDFGIDIKVDNNKYTMHHKFIIIDGKIVITGSPNFTLAGFNRNDENLLIIHDKKIAKDFLNEFGNLWQ